MTPIDFSFLLNVYFMVKVALYAVLADTIVGVFVALVKGNFDILVFPRFLAKNVLPYVGALLIFAFLADATNDPQMYMLFDICVVGVTAKFGWEAIFEKLRGFFRGTYEAKVA